MAIDTGQAATQAGRGSHPSVLSRSAAFPFVGLILMTLLLSSTVPSPMYVIYQQRWGFSAATLTVIFAIYALFVLGGTLLFGSLSDTLGRRHVLFGALALVIISMVLFIVAQGTGWLLAARAFQGAAVGIATATLGAALIELSPARGTQVNTTAPTLGMALGGLMAGLLVEFGPAPTILSYVILLVLFVLALIPTALMPETAPNAGGGFKIRMRRASVPSGARRVFALYSLTMIADWAVGGLYMSLGPSIVAQLLNSRSHLLGGLVVALLAGFGTVAQLVFGKLAGSRLILLGGTFMLVALIATLVALSAGSGVVFFVAAGVLGLGWGATFMGAFRGIAMLADPAHRAGLLAALYVVAYLSFSVPAIVAGIAVRSLGLHTTTTVFVSVVGVLVIASMATIPVVARRATASSH